jgi:hypothetical protein
MGAKKITSKKEKLENAANEVLKELLSCGDHISVKSALVHCRRMIGQIGQIKSEDIKDSKEEFDSKSRDATSKVEE